MKIHTSSPKGLLGPRSVDADRGHFIYRIVILEFRAEFRAIKFGDWRFVSKTQYFILHSNGLEPLTFGSVDRCSIQLSYECVEAIQAVDWPARVRSLALTGQFASRFRSGPRFREKVRALGSIWPTAPVASKRTVSTAKRCQAYPWRRQSCDPESMVVTV